MAFLSLKSMEMLPRTMPRTTRGLPADYAADYPRTSRGLCCGLPADWPRTRPQTIRAHYATDPAADCATAAPTPCEIAFILLPLLFTQFHKMR